MIYIRTNIHLFYHYYDIAPGSGITLCNKIDGLQVFEKCYDVHKNVAYLMTKSYLFYARNEISK